ncbi:hypothetical protein ACDI10_16400 [Vreelandella venusta]|uniref:hypothetical protein n=1 Tax=Vreelandella venusta TaxID=44935 RepID=UPI00355620F5
MKDDRKNEKFEFLYNYGRAAFEDELKRFQNIEAKAGKYLSFLSVGIAAYTYLVKTYAYVFFPPFGLFQWLILTVVGLTFFTLIVSWSHLYRALRFTDMPRMTYGYEIIDFVDNNSFVSAHYHFSKMAAQALDCARKRNEEKSKLLLLAYTDIVISVWLIAISAVFITGLNFNNLKEEAMSDQKDKDSVVTSQSEQTSQPPQPDRSLETPEVTFVQDHWKPELDQAIKRSNEKKD